MRTASKLVKHHANLRRILSVKVDGFTIVETMIVLAVTASLFLLAVKAVGGRQNETVFQQSINDFQSSIQQFIAHTVSGDYQLADNITCVPNASGFDIALSSSPTSTEGTNADCVFLGKVIQFANQTGSAPQQYITYPIVGLRNNNGNINNAKPAIVAPGNSSGNAFPDEGVHQYLHGGLTLERTKDIHSAWIANAGAFAIISSLGATAGSQQFYLVPLVSTNYNNDPSNMQGAIDLINAQLKNSYWSAIGAVTSATPYLSEQICLTSGTTKESGLITIGGNGGDINSVKTEIFSNKTCT